jgi:antirestriction protein ArdC
VESTSSGRDRIRKAQADVDAALERLAASLRSGKPEDVIEYLSFWSRFTRFSYHNALLILSQRPTATHVAGFQGWRKVGRFVKKGEKGIAILYPRVKAREDLDTGEKERFLSGFGVGYVFDVDQTDGEPLPQPPAWRATGPARKEDVDRIVAGIEASRIAVRLDRYDVEGRMSGADGVTHREGEGLRIVVRDDLPAAATVHTLLHEWAHAALHFGPDRPESRELRELEADAAACAVAAALGYDHTAGTYRYLATWDATAEGLGRALPRIGRGVRTILRGLGLEEQGQEEAA